MTLDEYKELKIEEIINAIRKPVEVKNSTIFQLVAKKYILSQILNLLECDGSIDNLEAYALSKGALKSLCGLVGEGSTEDPYRISTEFAKGGFMDVHRFLPGGKIPDYIQNNSCHRNCYFFAVGQTNNCEVITGIYQKDKDAHLHTVIGSNGVIIDFNWKLVMSEELYFKLFNFEVINRVQSCEIKENAELIEKHGPKAIPGLTYAETIACFDEIVAVVKHYVKENNV